MKKRRSGYVAEVVCKLHVRRARERAMRMLPSMLRDAAAAGGMYPPNVSVNLKKWLSAGGALRSAIVACAERVAVDVLDAADEVRAAATR